MHSNIVSFLADCFMSRTNDANSRLELAERKTERFDEEIEHLKNQIEEVTAGLNTRFEEMISNMSQLYAKNRQLESHLIILKGLTNFIHHLKPFYTQTYCKFLGIL